MLSLLSLLGGLKAQLITAGALVLAVLAAVGMIRRGGRLAERADQAEREREVIDDRREIEDQVRGADPAARRERLRGWASGGDSVRGPGADPPDAGRH